MLLRGIIFERKDNGQNIKSFMSRCPTRWKYLIQDSSKSPSTGARLLTRNLESEIQSNFYGGEWNFYGEDKMNIWGLDDIGWISFWLDCAKEEVQEAFMSSFVWEDKGKSRSCLIKIGRAWSHPTLSIHHDTKPPLCLLSSREIVLLGLAGLVCSLLLLLTTPI